MDAASATSRGRQTSRASLPWRIPVDTSTNPSALRRYCKHSIAGMTKRTGVGEEEE